MKTRAEVEKAMAGFTGTEAYHASGSDDTVLTDGVAWMSKEAGLGDVIRIIASQQAYVMKKNKGMKQLQIWTLRHIRAGEPHTLHGAKWMLEGSTGARNAKPVYSEAVGELPEFPMDTFQCWVEPSGQGHQVVLMPSEH